MSTDIIHIYFLGRETKGRRFESSKVLLLPVLSLAWALLLTRSAATAAEFLDDSVLAGSSD